MEAVGSTYDMDEKPQCMENFQLEMPIMGPLEFRYTMELAESDM